MLQFFLGVFLFFLACMILWRIFAPFLMLKIIKFTTGKMQEDFIKQANAFQENYDSEFEKTITLNQDMKVKVPHRPETKKNRNIRYVE